MEKRKWRLDELLVRRGFFPSRAKAQAALMAGQVLVEGRPLAKAGTPVDSEVAVEILSPCPFVSRGGLKLQAALERFKVGVEGRVCLDLGASTGGFTDCLLQRGAAKVFSVDVGRSQLADKLRRDPRVVNLEKTHARMLSPQSFDPPPDLAVADVSFISLTAVMPPMISCLEKPFDLVVLVKPQFEVGQKAAPKGVVREPAHREAAINRVVSAAQSLGLENRGLMESPLRGAKGNVEFFLWLQPKQREAEV